MFEYGKNSPTTYTDQNGLWITATQPQAQDAINYSVPLKMQEYIVFGQDGTLDAERLKEGIRATGDTTLFVRILDAMASDVETITVSMINGGESLPIMHPNGSDINDISLIRADADGMTLAPRRMHEALGKTDAPASRSGSMEIYIRIKNDAGHHPRHSTAFIHELGGHADLILQAYRDPALPRQQGYHRYNPDKTVDSNIVLVNRLKNLRVP